MGSNPQRKTDLLNVWLRPVCGCFRLGDLFRGYPQLEGLDASMNHTASLDLQPEGFRRGAALGRYVVALAFAVMLLPLPVLAGSALVVFIPAGNEKN